MSTSAASGVSIYQEVQSFYRQSPPTIRTP